MKDTSTQQTGRSGEDRAASYLQKKGYEILECNYRYGKGEIDLIALLNNELLVFVEVKARQNNEYGEPETFVSSRQQKLIIRAAEDYIFGINWQKDIRFDIIAISGGLIKHIEDAFY